MAIKPGTDAKYSDYNLWLVDQDGRGLGLKLCDNRGNASALSLRRQSYPRTTLQVNSGSGKWTDLQPPYGQITKNIFMGGLGMKDSEADQTKYWFGSGVWTCGANGVMLAPQWYRAQTAWPVRIENHPIPSDTVVWRKLLDTYIACMFTVGASDLVVAGIRLPIRSTGHPGGLMVSIRTNDTTTNDHPETVVTGTYVSTTTILLSSCERNFTFDTPVTLTHATKYWVVIHFAPGVTDHDYSEYLERASSFAASTSPSGTPTAAAWTTGATSFVFTLLTTTDVKAADFFTYKQATYCWMTDNDAAGAVHLFVNGDAGMADSNAGAKGTLVDATKSWPTNHFAGAVVRIYTGAGKDEWRNIVSNTATALTVDRDWVVTHDATTTCYAIIGARNWTEITGHGLAAVTDTAVGTNNGIVYFAQGSDADAVLPIRKMRAWNNAGVWELGYDSDDAGGADLLLSAYDQESKNVIWRARNGKTNNDVAMAPQVAWATDLTFETAIDIGSKEQDISGLFRWGNKIGVICMDRMWALLNKVPDQVTEWMATYDKNTGRHPVLMSSYVVFPKGNGIMRLVGDLIEDFGPEIFDGMPKRYSGQWVDLWCEEGILFAAKRSGSLMTRAYEPCGESGVYLYHGGGWHPVAHLDVGTGMHAIHRQVMDNKHDVLWMATRDTLMYCYVPRAFDYKNDIAFWNDLHVQSDGVLLLGKITAGSETTDKWWSSLNIYGTDLHTAYTNVEVYYRDHEPEPIAANGYAENVAADWTYLGEAEMGENATKIVMQVKSKQMWLLIRLVGDGTHTPVVQAITIDYMAQIEPADVWPVTFRLDDFAYMRNGVMSTLSARQAQAMLDWWSRDIRPVSMYSDLSFANRRTVKIERPSYQLFSFNQDATTPAGRESYFGSMTIMEAGVEMYRRPVATSTQSINEMA